MPRCWVSLFSKWWRGPPLPVVLQNKCFVFILLFIFEMRLRGRSHGSAWNTGLEGYYRALNPKGRKRRDVPEFRLFTEQRPTVLQQLCQVGAHGCLAEVGQGKGYRDKS